MKTLLNLLPEEKKLAIQRKLRLRFFLWQLFLLFVLEVFYASILVGIFFILDLQAKDSSLEEQGIGAQAGQQHTLSQFEERFRTTNDSVEVVSGIDGVHFHFERIFDWLEQTVPDGVNIDHLTTKEYTLSLSGRAATRDELLSFQEKMKGLQCVTSVETPLSNLFSQKNVDFQMDVQIQPDCMKKNPL